MDAEIKRLVDKYNANYQENEKIKEENEKKRKSFVEDFPIDKISSMRIEDFVLKEINGHEAKNRGPHGKGTFIYRMEQEKREQTEKERQEKNPISPWIMSISGLPDGRTKWGCYTIKDKSKFNDTIKKINKILDADNHNDLDSLIESKPLGNAAICKILATYYPREFLPNFNKDNALFFLKKVGINTKETNILKLNKQIMDWRDSNKETKNWDNLDITRFMYNKDYMNIKNSQTKNQQKNTRTVNKSEKGVDINMNNNKIDIRGNKNIILYGPPGTGKTYYTIPYSVAICRGITDRAGINEVLQEFKKDKDKIIDEYKKLKKDGNIEFITFHQSYGYEDFIEGIKPDVDDDVKDIKYSVEPGVFKIFCNKVEREGNFDKLYDKLVEKIQNEKEEQIIITTNKNVVFKVNVNSRGNLGVYIGKGFSTHGSLTKDKIYSFFAKTNPNNYWKTYYVGVLDYIESHIGKIIPKEKNKSNYVFIIDEINRGNISKIFGELITLIEETKRKGEKEITSLKLPLSGEEFFVPNNVYILGTMNTADRSIALLDTALRRRFKFIEMMPEYDVLDGIKIKEENSNVKNINEINIKEIAKVINQRIEALLDREHTIGHAYYLKLKDNSTLADIAELFRYSILPLLQEYFYDDYEKIRYVLGDNGKDEEFQFIKKEDNNTYIFRQGKNDEDTIDYDSLKPKYIINEDAFMKAQTYINIK